MTCCGCNNSLSSGRTELSVGLPGERIVAELELCDTCLLVVRNLTYAVLGKRDRVWRYPPSPEVPSIAAREEERIVSPEAESPPFSEKARAQMQGYTGDECYSCHQFMMVRSGTCLTCRACGSTSGGCS